MGLILILHVSQASTNNAETSKDSAIPGFGGITANDLLLLELLSKREGEAENAKNAARSKPKETKQPTSIDFAGLNLAVSCFYYFSQLCYFNPYFCI